MKILKIFQEKLRYKNYSDRSILMKHFNRNCSFNFFSKDYRSVVSIYFYTDF